MSEQTIQLIQYIKEGKTCNEICRILNISNKQLYNYLTILKNKGLLLNRKYYSNGSIIYKFISTLSEKNNYIKNSNTKSIITDHKNVNFRCLVISDLHFGSSLFRLDLVDRVYNYCIKNGIHIILCCGDMIDGAFSKVEQEITDIYSQIDYFIKNYPFDRNILTFAVGGDHDFSAITTASQDLIEVTNNYRHDIIISSYNNAYVNIKNDSIHLFHNVPSGNIIKNDSPIILRGHVHQFIVNKQCEKCLDVVVPSLSDINSSLPTAIDLTLEFNKGYIETTSLKQIYFSDKDYILNDLNYDLLSNRDIEIKPISYEEIMKDESIDITDEPVDVMVAKELARLNQIEKFEKRYPEYQKKLK